jgi:catechol 2,3-dioxygenase-like lactoylglutathione lyase family enzyme
MFANAKAYSGFAVDDVEKAREFYSETLGLKTSVEHGLMTLHLAGEPADAGLPQARSHAGDLHNPQLPRGGHRQGRRRARRARCGFREVPTTSTRTRRASCAASAADIPWFKDPAGNILSVLQEE